VALGERVGLTEEDWGLIGPMTRGIDEVEAVAAELQLVGDAG